MDQVGQSTNEGTIDAAAGNLTMNGGSLTNTATGVFNDQVDCTIGGSTVFTNLGLFVKSGDNGTTYLDTPFYNGGLVQVLRGILSLGDYNQTGNGTVSAGGGSGSANYGKLNNGSQITVNQKLVSSSYAQAPSAVLNELIGGVAAGTQYGQIQVTGAVALAGTLNVSFTNGFVSTSGESFTIIRNGGTSPILGSFAGLAEGAVMTVSGRQLQISYAGGPNHQNVVLTDVTPVSAFEGVNTGNLVLATFTVENPSALASDYTPIVDWGSVLVGTPTAAVQLVSSTATDSTWQVVGSATYAETGSYSIAVTVVDAQNNTIDTSLLIASVADAPLTDVTTASTQNAVEGNSTGNIALAYFTDANPGALLSDFTATVNWGDPTIGVPTVWVAPAATPLSLLYPGAPPVSSWVVMGNATYTDTGSYTVAVTVNDVDGSSVQSNRTTIDVADAPLTDITPVTVYNAIEGNSVGAVVLATFTDGDPSASLADFTASVNWGGALIGTPTVTVQALSQSATFSTWQVVGSATYAEKGNDVVAVSVNDVDGSSLQTSQTSVLVADAPLTDITSATTVSAVAGISTGSVVLATFTDGDPLASQTDYTASVNWGGSLIGSPSSAVQLVSRSATSSTWQVVGSATYLSPGNDTVTVSVNDVDGSSLQSSQTTFSVDPAALTAVEGNSTGTVVLAMFNDSNPQAPLSEFTATVNWGGTLVGTAKTSVQLVSRSAKNSTWEVVGSATYSKPGTYTITVTVKDSDGTPSLTIPTSIIVSDAPLTDISQTQSISLLEGIGTGSVVLATFTDGDPVEPASNFKAVVNWGGTLAANPTVSIGLVSRTSTLSTWEVLGSATYAEPGINPVVVTVNDVGGNTLQSSATTITVTEAPLTDISQTQSISLLEGNSTGLVVLATFTDGDPLAPSSDYTTTVNWGGTLIGNPTSAIKLVSRTSTLSTWEVVGSATYAEPGINPVVVTVNDEGGNTLQSSATTVTVTEAPLTDTTPASTITLYEGCNTGTVVLATFTDGDPNASLTDYTASVNWGGTLIGTPKFSVQLVSRTGTSSAWNIVGSAVYAAPGTYPAAVTVSDVDGATFQTSKVVFNVAVAPLTDTTPVKTLSAIEGKSTGTVVLATFTDADPQTLVTDFSPSVSWGGTVTGSSTIAVQLVSRSATASTWKVVGSATYVEAGSYTVSVAVSDLEGASVQTSNTTVSVADAPLTDITPVRVLNAVAGSSTGTVVVAEFTDGDPSASLTDYTYSVAWGGPVVGPSPTVSLQPISGKANVSTWQLVLGGLTYGVKGTYTPTVTINDVDGSSFQTAKTTFNVAAATLTDTSVAQTINVTAGSASTNVVLATFTDSNSWATSGYFAASVNWGGSIVGTPTVSVVQVGSVWEVVVDSVTYATKATYAITVSITDVDGISIQSKKTKFVVS